MFAVVKDDGCGYKFSKFHVEQPEAEKEAERLCALNNCKFMVLEVVGRCEPAQAPVKWTEKKGTV